MRAKGGAWDRARGGEREWSMSSETDVLGKERCFKMSIILRKILLSECMVTTTL